MNTFTFAENLAKLEEKHIKKNWFETYSPNHLMSNANEQSNRRKMLKNGQWGREKQWMWVVMRIISSKLGP